MNNTQTETDPYKLAALPIEYWEASDVKPYARNTKVHSKAHIATLEKSILEFGLFDPLILDADGIIIAGHGRWETLIKLGHAQVPVRIARHLTKPQADAARIAHNKTASTEYDSDFMSQEIRRLSEEGIDMSALGLDERELDFLVDDLGDMNMDAISVDLDQDIDDQDAETDDKVKATDASNEKLVKAFGFNELPIAAVKDVRRFMADIEQETGLEGQEALVGWLHDR